MQMAVVVAATNLRAPEVSMKPAWCRVRRPSSKNMVSASPKLSRLFLLICLLVGWQTKVELQAVQMALIEEKAKILQVSSFFSVIFADDLKSRGFVM